ncbi:MAG: response regulator [Cytophagales bacterium]|nr:response regulator [Cytophagales bacterium]
MQVETSPPPPLPVGLTTLFVSGSLVGVWLFNRYKARRDHEKRALENEKHRLVAQLQLRREIDETIRYFATSLYGKNTVDEILWDVAQNCISRLGFVDCVVYLRDESRQALVQQAAYGDKNPQDRTILGPLVIPLGQGIVGSVALSGRPERIADTSQDPRYIVDDQVRHSELAVPIFLHGQVIGVIDSEHPDRDFFREHHQEALQTIAAICSAKIARVRANEETARTRFAQLEANHLKRLDAIKSQFFANISHEFRTPLHLILAPLQKKEERITFQEMALMERNAYRLLRLVNQLLDLAKADVGTLKLHPRNGNVLQFLRHTAAGFTALAENKGLHYRIEVPEEGRVAPFDADTLEKIVYNLLANAIKFTPSGGEVTFRAALEPEGQLSLVVADSGLGVPAHLQDKIFDRFYQIDSSQTRGFEGTGIGLALAKELVDLCRGSIRVNSTAGRGASFQVLLPLRHEGSEGFNMPAGDPENGGPAGALPPADGETGDGTAAEGSRPTLLLVEDHAELRHYLKGQLSASFHVLTARQGDEGLSEARRTIPDLIISDVMMPGMDGLTLVRCLKADGLTSHIPVILLTARDDVGTKTEGFGQGAEQYLVKPFAFEELLAGINSLLTQRNRLRLKYSREVVLQPTGTTIPDREAEFLEKTIRIIEEHIMDESFTVETLQKEIGMSRMQLHRKLKALTDQSASDFIRSIRLKRAADLLQQPGIPVAEAAYLSGFGHLSYFAKCFKEQFGVLPSEYPRPVN